MFQDISFEAQLLDLTFQIIYILRKSYDFFNSYYWILNIVCQYRVYFTRYFCSNKGKRAAWVYLEAKCL